MTLEYITNYIDKKINNNDKIIRVTFYELNVRENLDKEEIDMFLKLSKQRLINLGYKIYEIGEEYNYEGKKRVVKNNMMYVAINLKEDKNGHF